MGMLDVGGILIAIIAALGAWAAQRSAAKASGVQKTASLKLEAERDAYERARAFDVDTIDRQDLELKALREENKILKEEIKHLKERLNQLEQRLPNGYTDVDDH